MTSLNTGERISGNFFQFKRNDYFHSTEKNIIYKADESRSVLESTTNSFVINKCVSHLIPINQLGEKEIVVMAGDFNDPVGSNPENYEVRKKGGEKVLAFCVA